jgi:hypothetical protein
MAGTTFKAVDLGKVEQGKFQIDCEKAFIKLQKEVIKHHEKHEIEVSGKLTMTIEIKAKDGGYRLIGNIVEKLPTEPRNITTAFAADTDEGDRCLFSAAGGTSTANPKQAVLCHDDGSKIEEPETTKTE